jgi:hypothetical protein
MLLEGCGDTFLLRLCGIAARCELITAEKLVEYHGLGTSAESKLDLAAISKELADCLDKASSPLKKKFCNDCTAIVSRCSGQSSCKCSGRGSEGKACGYTDLVSKLCQALLDGARLATIQAYFHAWDTYAQLQIAYTYRELGKITCLTKPKRGIPKKRKYLTFRFDNEEITFRETSERRRGVQSAVLEHPN